MGRHVWHNDPDEPMNRPILPILLLLVTAPSVVAHASVDMRFGTRVEGASAVLRGTARAGEGFVTLEIAEVLAGAHAEPTVMLAETVPTDREFPFVGEGIPVPSGEPLLVLLHGEVPDGPHRDFDFFRQDTPEYRLASAAVAVVDELGGKAGAVGLDPLAAAPREDLVFLQQQVFGVHGLSDACRLEFLGIVLQQADPTWQADLFPALSHDPVPGSATLWLEWLNRHPIDAIPSEYPETLLQRLADPAAGSWLIRRLGYRRVEGDSLFAVFDALAACDPVLCSCALTQVAREDPWPHVGHHRNEEVRADLVAHLAALGVSPNPRCILAWTAHFATDLPPGSRDPRFVRTLEPDARHRLLMHLALYHGHDEDLVAWLIRLGDLEPGVKQQDEATMAAARILARAPHEASTTATALVEHLRRKASRMSPGDARGSLAAAGVLAARRGDVLEVLMAQYDAGDAGQQEWALRVLGETDVRLADPMDRQRLISLLVGSNPDGEYRWLESSTLAHVERLTGEVYPVVHDMVMSRDELTRVRGLRWAAGARIRPGEMYSVYEALYLEGEGEGRAMALWAVATVIGSEQVYDRAVPLLPQLMDDLHHPHETVRQQARSLLGQLVAKECAVPGRWAGLDGIVTELGGRLRAAEGERREQLAGFLGGLREACLPGDIARELDR